jgi:hypothetical protein
MTPTPGSRLLVFRRGATLWGVPAGAVRAVVATPLTASELRLEGRGHGAALRIETPGPALLADRVEGWSGDLAVRAIGQTLARLWPAAGVGLGVWRGEPLVVVDPLAPPAVLVSGPCGVDDRTGRSGSGD